MKMYDTIYHPLECKRCGRYDMREIRTTELSNDLQVYKVGDVVVDPRPGHFYVTGTWSCQCDFENTMYHTCYIEVVYGLIVAVHEKLPRRLKSIEVPTQILNVVQRSNRYYREIEDLLIHTIEVLQSFRPKKEERGPWWYKVDSWEELVKKLVEEVKSERESELRKLFGYESSSEIE